MPASHSPFVGRQRELGSLLAQLDAAGEGLGRLVLLAGEPGIGKTRLLGELVARASARGWLVLAGRAYDGDGLPPYLPFVEALGSHLAGHSAEDVRDVLGSAAAGLALLLPDLRERLPGLAPPPSISPEHERYRLFEIVCEFLSALARGTESRGLLLALDDLHWADTPALLLLRHLARRIAEVPLLVVGAYRREDLGGNHPLLDLLAALRREDLGETLDLAVLADDEAALLVAQLSGAAPAPEVAAAIQRQAEGNPFFLGEVVRHLQAEGIDLANASAAGPRLGLPEGVRQVIGRRLARLSTEAQAALQAAAVLGEGFTFAELRELSGLEEEPLLDALDVLLAAGMLRDAGDTYQFSHALIRETVYASLSLPRRERLHRRAAEAMERLYAPNLTPHVAALASHWRLAGSFGDRDKLLDYSLRAGENARAVFAYEEAARHWQTSLALSEAREPGSEQRAMLLERLGDLMCVSGLGWEKGIAYLETAIQQYTARGEAERAAEVHTHLGEYCSTFLGLRDIPGALVHFRTAEALLAQRPEQASLGHIFIGRAAAALAGVQTEEGLAASKRAMEVAERLGDEALWANAACLHGSHLCASGQLAAGLGLLDRAWETADRLNHVVAGYAATWQRSWWSLRLGDTREAEELCLRELRKPRAAQAPVQRSRLLQRLGQCHHQAGSLDAAWSALAESDIRMESEPLRANWEGNWEQAQTLWMEQRVAYRRAGDCLNEMVALRYLGMVAERRGQHVQAETLLQEALAIAGDGANVLYEIAIRVALALIACTTGHLEKARRHVMRSQEILAGGEDWRGLVGSVIAAEAAATFDEDPDAAGRRFEQAIAIFRRYTLPWDEAEALTSWARGLLRVGRKAAAAARLEAAGTVYRRHGAGAPWCHSLSTLQALPGSPGKRPPAYPDGLSAREVEVLRLAAVGRSNPQIAAALSISRNTVLRHMNHIFVKTGAGNRTEAAAYAHRHGLTEPEQR